MNVKEPGGLRCRAPRQAWLLALFAVGCGPDAPESQFTSVDSVGVEIVHSQAPKHPEALRPQDSPREVFVSTSVSSSVMLQDVREAVRISDGRVVTVDFGARELRSYDVTGALERVWARRGGGPGELQYPSDLRVFPGDSVEVWDRRLGRLYRFDPAGDLVSTLRFQRPDIPPPVHLSSLSRDVWVGEYAMTDRTLVAVESGIARLTVTPQALVVLGADGVIVDTLAVQVGYRNMDVGSGSMAPAVGSRAPWVVSTDAVVVGDGQTPEYRVVDASGGIRRIVRWAQPRHRLDPDSLFALAATLGSFDRTNPILDPAFLPDTFPAYKELRVFGQTTWVGSATPFRLPPAHWQVFDAAGTWLAQVDLRAGSQILSYQAGHLLVLEADSLGVQSVAGYAFELPR